MKKKQIFGIPTYDALFKWVLDEDAIRPSFFHAFIPGIVVQSSERLDDHMNPWQELQLLRDIIHDKDAAELVTNIKENQHKVAVHVADAYHDKATDLMKSLLHHFEDIQYSFPKVPFDGKMDFVCLLDTGEYALVEMQVNPEECWDQRALGYVAAYFGNQLRKGGAWKDIRKVIGVNILGGGKDDVKHWPETPKQYMRHYKLQEQIHKENLPRYLEGIEILQYSLANAPKEVNSQEQKDWLRFFTDAHNMSEEDVQRDIKTPAVLKAFERARLIALPEKVRDGYRKEEIMYDNLSGYIEGKVAKGKEEGIAEGITKGKKEVAQILLKEGVPLSIVQEATGLTEKEILAGEQTS